MNAHQRKKWMCEKHMRLPLGSAVIVHGRPAKISKHDSRRMHCCVVEFTDKEGSWSWVTIKEVKPVLRLKVRPWWRKGLSK